MPETFDRCVREVKKKIDAGKLPAGSSAYAICNASMYGKRKDKKAHKK